MDYKAHTRRMSLSLVFISEQARYWTERAPEHAHMLTEILEATKKGLKPYVDERRENGTLPPVDH